MKIVQSNTKQTISNALKKFIDLIAPTYGPAGKKVLLASNEFTLKAADDGHAAASDFEIENEFENAVIMYIKEATSKTNSRVGDGTTTATILTNALTSPLLSDDNPFRGNNYHKEVQEIQKATKEAVDYIKSKAKKIESAEELYGVAYNSYNNEEIAKLIADTLFKIGRDGILAIEDSQTAFTEVELVEGVEIEKGYASPYLINTKDEVVLNDPAFIVYNGKMERFLDVVPVLKNLVEKAGRKDFVIIAEGFSEDFLGNTIMHKVRGLFSPLLVEAPGFGDSRIENLKNIAAVVGATIFDPKTKKLSEGTLEDFGEAKKIVAKKDKTVIIGGNKEKIEERVEELKKEREATTQDFTKEKLSRTIASLQGGIALIKVGANTENEQKSIKMKVEDAVNATKVAFQDGVVAGGGKTYAQIKTNSEFFNEALQAPRKQLEDNGAEFLDEEVVDPAGVLIAALETASSIACGLLTMGGIIATKRKPEKDE